MEKFAVDLDKVLDEFEKNENVGETDAPTHGVDHSRNSDWVVFSSNKNALFQLGDTSANFWNADTSKSFHLGRTDQCVSGFQEASEKQQKVLLIPSLVDSAPSTSVGDGVNKEMTLASTRLLSESTDATSLVDGESFPRQSNAIPDKISASAERPDLLTCDDENVTEPQVNLMAFVSHSVIGKDQEFMVANKSPEKEKDGNTGVIVSSQDDDFVESETAENECNSLLARGVPDGEQGTSDAREPIPLSAAQDESSDTRIVDRIPVGEKLIVEKKPDGDNLDASECSEFSTPPLIGFSATFDDNLDISDSEIENYLDDVAPEATAPKTLNDTSVGCCSSPKLAETKQDQTSVEAELTKHIIKEEKTLPSAVDVLVPSITGNGTGDALLDESNVSASFASELEEDGKQGLLHDIQVVINTESSDHQPADSNETDPALKGQAISNRVQRPTSLNIRSQVIVAPLEQNPEAVSQQILSAISESSASQQGPEVQQSTPEESLDIPGSSYPNSMSIFNNKDLVGKVKPFWIPDADADNCMHCDVKFTVIKRRHHCRACGKVLCSQCCSQKAKLFYLDNKEARVCQPCFGILNNRAGLSATTNSQTTCQDLALESPTASEPTGSALPSPGTGPDSSGTNSLRIPNPNNPNEYCSTISPLEQAQAYLNRPPPTVMVPVGVLKRGDKPRGEPKQVMFSDGIRPGSDLTELDEPTEVNLPQRRTGRIQKRVDKVPSPSSEKNVGGGASPPPLKASTPFLLRKGRWGHSVSPSRRLVISDRDVALPPIVLPPNVEPGENPGMDNLLQWLCNEQVGPVTFVLTKNLHVFCKIVKLDCCTGQQCWNFTSCGMATVGQDEVVLLLERELEAFPHDAFHLFSSVYDSACKGSTVGHLGHVLVQGVLGSRDNSGFLFVQSTFQCLNGVVLPPAPYLFALLIQKWEVPWAKAFPLRLMLRLGAEFRCYPCPLVSVQSRKPVYAEIGHTIMNVLADFRNFQYTLPVVQGMLVHVEDHQTTVSFPRNRYENVVKVLNNSNEYVLTFGANFSLEADSHLVCVQNEGGSYATQAINIQDAPRKTTGASFIVFSGALKAAAGLTAKSSIVEDGLLVQMPQDTMATLRIALRDMRDYVIGCGPVGASEPDEVILLRWTQDDKNFNVGVKSPIDGRSMDGVPSVRIHSGTDYAGEYHLIRWTEVFFLQTEDGGGRIPDAVDPSRLAETVSQECCIALTPHLALLVEAGYQKIGLRITLGGEKVGYEIGSRGELLPDMYMNDLDSALIPVIMSAVTVNLEQCIVIELIFHILLK